MNTSESTRTRVQPIILAGGLGTRLRPRTLVLPKPLLPVRGRPLLWYAIDALDGSNVKPPVVTIDYLGELIEAYFQDSGVIFRRFAGASMAESTIRVAEEFPAEAYLGMSADVLVGRTGVRRALTLYDAYGENTLLLVRLPRSGHKKWEFEITDGYLRDIHIRPTSTSFERLLLILRRDSLLNLRTVLPQPITDDALSDHQRRFQTGWMLLLRTLLDIKEPVRAEFVDLPVQNVNVPADLEDANHFVSSRLQSHTAANGGATILIAPGPFKECLSSPDVADAMRRGVMDILPGAQVIMRPLSDGGSGIKKLLVAATAGSEIPVVLTGPLGNPISTSIGLLGDGTTAVIESAAICGLALVSADERNPLHTTTFGVGEAIIYAVRVLGARRIILGCGDSATNDCGIGMASALGVRFGNVRPAAALTGADLSQIGSIDTSLLPSEFRMIPITVACNLTSVLCGSEGTSRIYGPQKGALPEQVAELETGVENYAATVRRDLGMDVSFLPGAGGAGGLAASLYAILGASLRYSFDVIDEFLQLDNLLKQSTLVLTGEGTLDDRTATGKVACAIALRAKKYNLPVVAIAGIVASDCEDIYYNGIDAAVSIQNGPLTHEESLRHARELITDSTSRALRMVFRIGDVQGAVTI